MEPTTNHRNSQSNSLILFSQGDSPFRQRFFRLFPPDARLAQAAWHRDKWVGAVLRLSGKTFLLRFGRVIFTLHCWIPLELIGRLGHTRMIPRMKPSAKKRGGPKVVRGSRTDVLPLKIHVVSFKLVPYRRVVIDLPDCSGIATMPERYEDR
jgi:hypothetical protein